MTTPSLVADSPQAEIAPQGGFTREAVLALSERNDEPQWLRESRLEGWQAFEELPVPRWTKGIAQWWTTDVSALNLSKMLPVVEKSYTTDQARSIGRPRGRHRGSGRAAGADRLGPGIFAGARQPEGAGVIFSSLQDAVRQHPEIVEKYLHKLVAPNKDKFSALHTAFWSGGVFLYVPEGVTVELPIHVVYRLETPGAAALGHTLVIAERGSNVRYIEEFHSSYTEGQGLHSGVIEVSVGEDAKVEFTSMQEWGRNVYSFATRYARVDKDAG